MLKCDRHTLWRGDSIVSIGCPDKREHKLDIYSGTIGTVFSGMWN